MEQGEERIRDECERKERNDRTRNLTSYPRTCCRGVAWRELGLNLAQFSFKSAFICSEAQGIIEALRSSTEASMRQARELVLLRAMVIEEHQPQSPDELQLQRMDVVMVTKMTDDNWWEGFLESASKSGQVVGRFPARCVQSLHEDTLAKKLREEGYFDFSNLPSAAEWKVLLLGGREHTFRQVRESERERERDSMREGREEEAYSLETYVYREM